MSFVPVQTSGQTASQPRRDASGKLLAPPGGNGVVPFAVLVGDMSGGRNTMAGDKSPAVMSDSRIGGDEGRSKVMLDSVRLPNKAIVPSGTVPVANQLAPPAIGLQMTIASSAGDAIEALESREPGAMARQFSPPAAGLRSIIASPTRVVIEASEPGGPTPDVPGRKTEGEGAPIPTLVPRSDPALVCDFGTMTAANALAPKPPTAPADASFGQALGHSAAPHVAGDPLCVTTARRSAEQVDVKPRHAGEAMVASEERHLVDMDGPPPSPAGPGSGGGGSVAPHAAFLDAAAIVARGTGSAGVAAHPPTAQRPTVSTNAAGVSELRSRVVDARHSTEGGGAVQSDQIDAQPSPPIELPIPLSVNVPFASAGPPPALPINLQPESAFSPIEELTRVAQPQVQSPPPGRLAASAAAPVGAFSATVPFGVPELIGAAAPNSHEVPSPPLTNSDNSATPLELQTLRAKLAGPELRPDVNRPNLSVGAPAEPLMAIRASAVETHLPPSPSSASVLAQVHGGVVRAFAEFAEADIDPARGAERASVVEPARTPLRVLTIQLEPASLGSIDIRIELTGPRLQVRVAAEEQAAASLILEQRGSLIESLRENGYDVDAIIVTRAIAVGDGSAHPLNGVREAADGARHFSNNGGGAADANRGDQSAARFSNQQDSREHGHRAKEEALPNLPRRDDRRFIVL